MSVSLAQVQAAARRIAPHIRRTPLIRAEGLSETTGRDTWLKLESLQRTRAFKRRGACNAVLALRERESILPPLVTASAGNHALALASIARELGARLTIFVPRDAPRAKLDRLRGSGITIVADCRDYDDAESRALAASAAAARHAWQTTLWKVLAGFIPLFGILQFVPGWLLPRLGSPWHVLIPAAVGSVIERSANSKLSARARMRAVVVLPTPRTPVRTHACGMRPDSNAFETVRTIASWPTRSSKVEGRYLRASTR